MPVGHLPCSQRHIHQLLSKAPLHHEHTYKLWDIQLSCTRNPQEKTSSSINGTLKEVWKIIDSILESNYSSWVEEAKKKKTFFSKDFVAVIFSAATKKKA